MKKSFLLLAAIFLFATINAQQFYEGFGSLPLQTYSASGAVTNYTTIPAGFSLINDGHSNNAGSGSNPNAPFQVPSLKTSGWAVIYNAADNDTFLVSTSWLDTTTITCDRWVITPAITNITANSVLTWLAKSPDGLFRDGYEVYGTNKTGTLQASDFSISDRLFSLPDGHTSGGGEKTTWTRHSAPLAAFAGQTMRFAFRNNSTNMFQLWIDDIEVKNVTNSLDGAVSSLNVEKYILTNSAHSVSVNYFNNGAATINTVTLNYKYGTSSPVSQVFTFANGLTNGETTQCIFSLPYLFSSPGCYPLKVWATLPNNSSDQDLSNDTIAINITAVNASAQKNVLVEQFLSANNGESPDAQEKLFALQSPSVILVNIHDNDSLKENNSAGVLAYKKQFATALIDRKLDSIGEHAIKRQFYQYRVNQRLTAVTPASVNIINKTYNSGNKQLSFTLNSDFIGDVKGDYRLNAYLVENHVHGKTSDTTVNGYNQLNNYFNIPWSTYYQQGYFSAPQNSWVLNAKEYKQERVLIHSFDGSFGSTGVIPQTGGTAGQSYQQTFTVTIPTSTNGASIYNADNIYIVAFITEYNTNPDMRDIINSVEDKLTANPEIVGVNEQETPLKISIYPNPTNGVLFIENLNENKNYQFTIYDLLGKRVFEQNVKNTFSGQKLDLSALSEGAYLLEVRSGNLVFREKIVKQ
jgi:hypothetical protein